MESLVGICVPAICARDPSMLKGVVSGKYRFGELTTMSPMPMVCIIITYYVF